MTSVVLWPSYCQPGQCFDDLWRRLWRRVHDIKTRYCGSDSGGQRPSLSYGQATARQGPVLPMKTGQYSPEISDPCRATYSFTLLLGRSPLPGQRCTVRRTIPVMCPGLFTGARKSPPCLRFKGHMDCVKLGSSGILHTQQSEHVVAQ